jgi:hypothetical protein
MTLLPDSYHYTPSGRRLLATLGVVEPDPLRCEAERWLDEHEGCVTPATRHVRAALGVPWPADWLAASRAFRNVK